MNFFESFSLASVLLHSLSLAAFIFFFLSSLSPEEPKKPDLQFSLSPSRSAFQPPSPTTAHHHVVSRSSLYTPEVQPWSQPKVAAVTTTTATSPEHLPSSTPATKGLHLRRDNDQKNHLEVLYTKVLIISPLDTLEKSHCYCSYFSFCMQGE